MTEPRREPRMECEHCIEQGIAFNDDGKWLCEDCLMDEAIEKAMPGIVAGKYGDAS